MQNTYTAVLQQDGDWWIGWIEEIPGVNCQEATKGELLETLRVTLVEAIELNREEALRDVARLATHESGAAGPHDRDEQPTRRMPFRERGRETAAIS